MGYSNNKWRKILTILMIVNLCFILFAKFTTVFGASFDSSNFGNIEIEVPDWLDDYNVMIHCFDNTNNYYRITIYYCDKSYKIYNYQTPYVNQFYYINSSSPVTVYSYTTGIQAGAQNTANMVKNLTQSNFTSSTINPINNSTPLCSWVQKNTTRTDQHYNFNIYNWGNDEVYSQSNLEFIKYPEIANSLSDLESLNFEVISINAWDWSNKEFYVLFYDRNVIDTDTTEGLYPKRVIKLNKNTSYYQPDLSANPNKNAIFWIPIDEIGLNLYIGGDYEIRLAERKILDPPVFGATWSYHYLGEFVKFTVSSNVSQDKINAINQEIEDTTNKKYHEETINSINNINDNINNLNNNMNNVNNALTNTTPDSSINNDITSSFNYNKSNSQLTNNYNGFFSRLTTILSNIYDYDLSSVSTINIPFPHSNKSLVLRSDIISSHIVDPLKSLISAFWMFIFYYYCWRFLNFMFIQIEEGKILDEQDPSNVPGTLYASIF